MTSDRVDGGRKWGSFQVLILWLSLPALATGMASLTAGGCKGKVKESGGQQEIRASERASGLQGSTRPRRRHSAFVERVDERRRMVNSQIEAREVRDANVLKALRIVPRHAFVPAAQQAYAYEDGPLPIGYGQTISQPYIVAFMTEALRLDPNSVVLEIGTGSGYQAAVCAEIAREVYTIEIVEPLARSAAELLAQLGYATVHVRAGDGYFGWADKGPFDAIIGTAAAEQIPPPLLDQLKKGGRMILPVVGEDGFQYLVVLTKDHQGQLQRRTVLPVRFVPMTGRVQQPLGGPDH